MKIDAQVVAAASCPADRHSFESSSAEQRFGDRGLTLDVDFGSLRWPGINSGRDLELARPLPLQLVGRQMRNAIGARFQVPTCGNPSRRCGGFQPKASRGLISLLVFSVGSS